jgi:hypothetical protein
MVMTGLVRRCWRFHGIWQACHMPLLWLALLFLPLAASAEADVQISKNPIEVVRTDTYKPFQGWVWYVNQNGLALGFNRGPETPRFGPKVHQKRAGQSLWESAEFFCDPDDMLILIDKRGKILAMVYLQELEWRLDHLHMGENILVAQSAKYRTRQHDIEILTFTRMAPTLDVIKREIHVTNNSSMPVRIAWISQDARVMQLPRTDQDSVELFVMDGNRDLRQGTGSLGVWQDGIRIVGSTLMEKGISSGYIVGHGVGLAGNRIGYLGDPNTDTLYQNSKKGRRYPVHTLAELEASFLNIDLSSGIKVNYLYFPPLEAKKGGTVSFNFFQFGLISEPGPSPLKATISGFVETLEMLDAQLQEVSVAKR